MDNINEKEFVPLQYGIPPEGLGKFKINRLGEILRIEDNKILAPTLNLHEHGDGYPRAVLPLGNQVRVVRVLHRLVALHFVENDDPENKTQVDHKDRNPQNYHYLNLAWVTSSENKKNRVFTKKETDRLVFQKLDDQKNLIEEIPSSDVNKNMRQSIYDSIHQIKKYKGYFWNVRDLRLEAFIAKYGEPKEWKTIKRFTERETQCSDNGLIRFKNSGGNWEVTPGHPNEAQYMTFNYGKRAYRVHRLVYETFVNNGEELSPDIEIDHINTDTFCNDYHNLLAVTHKENMNNPLTRIKSGRKVKMFSMSGEFQKEFISIADANRYLDISTNNSQIVDVCKHKKVTSISYKNHLWCYDGDEEFIEKGVLSLIFQYDKDKNLIEVYEPYGILGSLKNNGYNVNYYQYEKALKTGKICSAGYYFSKGPRKFD